MFTGLIRDVGRVIAIKPGGDRGYVIATQLPAAKLGIGASIACNGVCLTVTEAGEGQFRVQVSAETLSKTTAGNWREGTLVNLEPSLCLGDEIGGHMVYGHVDGVAEVTDRKQEGDSLRFKISPPQALMRYIALKGSVALDGVSLTVNDVLGSSFDVNIIPHTQSWTNFGTMQPGARLNLETDMIARYLDRLIATR